MFFLVCCCVLLCVVCSVRELQQLWDVSWVSSSVSIGVVLYNGATSFRSASDTQKKRFRGFMRQMSTRKENAAAKDIDVYDMRERGVQKCIAVLFQFPPNPHTTSSSSFMLPVWRPKEAEALAEDTRLQVGEVLRQLLGSTELLKLTFEAKELLCILMRFFQWFTAPVIAGLIDVQVGAWLLSPNAREKDRAKYSLLRLLPQYCACESDYPIDVSDKPGDIMRGLKVDLVDVRERLWPAIQLQLGHLDMLPLFHAQVTPVLSLW